MFSNNRLTSEIKDNVTTTYTYYNNGNTIGKAIGTTLDVYSYNLYNQLTGNIIGGVNASYTYNAKGIRTSKTVGTDVTSFILDGGNVIAEVKGTEVVDYIRGINLICTVSEYYIYNAHGDVVGLTSTSGIVTKTYAYDAFGNEANPSSTDANPFRYCGEYYDTETGTYYLRARYYSPTIGRFTAEDTHWNTSNMIYGDNPQKINEREDALGLKRYSYAPQISAVMQSGNLYAYCGNNPVFYFDYSGKFIITTAALLIAGGALLGGVIGGLVGNHVANEKGATGWEKVGYIAGGTLIGGAIGALVGAVAAPAVTSATGVAGISVSTAGVSTIAAIGTSFGKMGTLIAQKPDIVVNWATYAKHGLQRLAERGITQKMVDSWVATGKVLQQAQDKFVFITKEGVAVVTSAGKLITAYAKEQFDESIIEIIKRLFGE